MKIRIKKAIVLLLVIWFSVTCYSSLARIRKAYFPSAGWHSPYLENLREQEEIEQGIGETRELLEAVKQGQRVEKPGLPAYYVLDKGPPRVLLESGWWLLDDLDEDLAETHYRRIYYSEDEVGEELRRLGQRKVALQKIPAFDKMAMLLRFRQPSGDELPYFYQNAHRVVKGEIYLLFLLNLIPLSVAGAAFYLLQNKTRQEKEGVRLS